MTNTRLVKYLPGYSSRCPVDSGSSFPVQFVTAGVPEKRGMITGPAVVLFPSWMWPCVRLLRPVLMDRLE